MAAPPADMSHVQAPPLRTRIKFCGMTREQDLRLAAHLGVDAIGLVFAQRSRRRVTPAQGAALRAALPPLVASVALFMDNDADEVRQVVETVRPGVLQFHGDEDDAFCRAFGLPYLKAIAMGGAAASADGLRARYPGAVGLLLDGHAAGEAGGTGRRFDWSRVPADPGLPFLLAGGLGPDNVHDAIVATRPWGVDVASGVEAEGQPGVKDAARMQRFVEEVRRADAR